MTIKASRMFDRDMQHESWRRTKDEKEATVDIACGVNRIADAFERIAAVAEHMAGLCRYINCPSCDSVVKPGECRYCHNLNS